MGYYAAVANEDDARYGACGNGLVTAVVDFTSLVVDPFTLGEVADALVAALEEWGYEDLGSEYVLVFYVPSSWVVGELNEECSNHGEATIGAVFGLCVDVGHEFVFEFCCLSEGFCEVLTDEPGFGWRCTMCTAV